MKPHIKTEIANKISDLLIQNNMIHIEEKDYRDNSIRVTGRLNVVL